MVGGSRLGAVGVSWWDGRDSEEANGDSLARTAGTDGNKYGEFFGSTSKLSCRDGAADGRLDVSSVADSKAALGWDG